MADLRRLASNEPIDDDDDPDSTLTFLFDFADLLAECANSSALSAVAKLGEIDSSTFGDVEVCVESRRGPPLPRDFFVTLACEQSVVTGCA